MADDIRLVIGVDDRDLIRTQKEQKKFERNLLTIESAFRKGDITAKRYASELNKQAKQLSMLGGSYNKANSEVRKYAASLRKATDDQIRMTQATNMAGKSTNRFGMYAQQVGYQVGDFFVQVQSGTSALVAFGQQGTQLAGLLPGVAGAVVGISLAIGTMLLRSFMDVSDAANIASAKLKTFEENLKSAREEAKDLRNELVLLSSGFESVSEMALSEAVDRATDKLEDAQKKLAEATTNAALVGQGAAGGIDLFSLFGASTEDRVADAKELVAQAALELASLKEMQRQSKERARNASVVNQLVEARGIIQDKANKKEGESYKRFDAHAVAYRKHLDKIAQANTSAQQELNLLIQKNVLLQLEKDHTKDYSVYKQMALGYEQDNLRAKLEAKGVDEKIIKDILAQLSIQARVTQEISDSADAAERLKNNLEVVSTFRVGGDMGEFANVAGGLDAFGGAGSFKYGGSQKFIPKKDTVVKESDLEKLRAQLDLEDALLGKTEARQRVIQALGVKFVENNPKTVAGLEAQITANENLLRIEEERKRMNDLVTDSMEDGLMAMADGTKSVSDAFRDMAREIIAELYRILVVQQMVNAAKSFFGFPFADGGAFSGGSQIQAYADGGVVGGPTMFPMAGGKTGLMGEAGPEAIMPLKRGANGKLGVQMEGGGGDTINVVQNFSFQANGDDSVKKIIAQAAPQIANMTKKSLLDDRRRGGTTKAVFG
jgi:hypothetical protein